MFTSTKTSTVVGLEIESESIAATELRVNGRVEVSGCGIEPLAGGVFNDGEVADVDGLASSLKDLFTREKLGRNVRLGIANQKIAVRTLRLPVIDDAGELETAIRFQAQDQIPMPLDQAVLDWEVVGEASGPNGERQVEVVVVAARRDMLSSLMTAMRQAGLRPIGIDLSAFAMIRALSQSGRPRSEPTTRLSYEERRELERASAGEPGAAAPAAPHASLLCNLGDVTNLAVVRGRNCVFTRITSFGVEGIAQKLAESRVLTLEHSRQWLDHVGLERPLEEIDGDAEIAATTRRVLVEGASRLADEIRLSLEFYRAQESSLPIEELVICGRGSTIPGLAGQLEGDLGLAVRRERPEALSHLDESSAARLTLAFGLALER